MPIEKERRPTTEITHVGDYPVIPEVINGVKVNFVGVVHSTEYLKKHYDEFESIIYNSSLVISDAVPFEYTSLPDKTKVNPDGLNFFSGIADIAKISPKKISVVDPNTTDTTVFDVDLGGFILGATGIYIAEKAIKIISGKEKLTRRNFVKALAATEAILVTGLQGPIANEIISKTRNGEIISTHGLDDTVAFSNNNYRNAFSAYAIDHITKQPPNSKLPITHIGGAAQTQNIISYLKENKTEGQLKKRLYDLTPYHLLGRQSIRN